MKYLVKYTDEIVDKVRNGATAKELGLKPREYEYIKRYRIQGKGKRSKGNVSTGITGRRSWHSKPIGSERFDKDGYILVKIAYPRVERRKQFIEWEKHYPPTDKKTECLIFLDGDKTNCSIDNLFKIKRKYIGCLNNFVKDKQLTPEERKTMCLIAELYCKMKEKRKEHKPINKQARKDLTQEKHEQIIAMWLAGENANTIAEILGYTKSSVTTLAYNFRKEGKIGCKYNKIKRTS